MTDWISELPRPKNAYGFIYVIINLLNDMGYIGQKMFRKGWENYYGSCEPLKDDIKKYGKQNFLRVIIRYESSEEALSDTEYRFLIAHDVLNATFEDGSPKWYNGNITWMSHRWYASCRGRKASDETRRRQSDAKKGKPQSQAQIDAALAKKGKPQSQAQIDAALAKKGKPSWNKDKTLSDEHRVNLSIGHMGRVSLLKGRVSPLKGIHHGRPPGNKGKVSPKKGIPNPVHSLRLKNKPWSDARRAAHELKHLDSCKTFDTTEKE